MIQTDFIRVIKEQREEIPELLKTGWVGREQESSIRIDSRLVQVITGVRRAGKSTLAHRVLAGIPYAYANFDDERLYQIKAEDLDHLLEALYSVYGDFNHLLLDEVQNVNGWHLFVNRLLRKNIHIVLTGSNSKLLNLESATHLTGRYSPIELMPYSFREFLAAKGIEGLPENTAKSAGLFTHHFIEYLSAGGMPEIVSGDAKPDYPNVLLEDILTRDIIYRHGIRHIRTFREIARFLISSFGKEISYNRIKNLFGLGSDNTVKNYLGYLEEAWLVMTLPKFSFKNQENLRYRKIYTIDSSFCRASGTQFSSNSGRLLENAVFLELMRRSKTAGYEVFFYKKVAEVDFVLYRDRKVLELIQVAEQTMDVATRKREVRALVAASDDLKTNNLTIITLNEEFEIMDSGRMIRGVRVTEWLFS